MATLEGMLRRDLLRLAASVSTAPASLLAGGQQPREHAAAMAALERAQAAFPFRIQVERFSGSHIIREEMLPGPDGASINGPAMMRVPAWVPNPLGRYYLYFAHHNGKYIRMAVADSPEGPWKIHPGGVLPLDQLKVLRGHVASPEVLVDEAEKRILLFVHGRPATGENAPSAEHEDLEEGRQVSTVAVSRDGLRFDAIPAVIGPAYLRTFRHKGLWYAVNGGQGTLYRSESPTVPFRASHRLIGPEIAAAIDPAKLGEPGAPLNRPASGPDRYGIRHPGIDIHNGWLIYYFSCVGHRPERILATAVRLEEDPASWTARGITEVLQPETQWEGADLPLAYAKGGRSRQWERGLRDPAIFREGNKTWLLYASAGEHGLGMVRLRYEG